VSLTKNVGSGERWLRLCAGVLMIACGLVFLRGMVVGYVVAGAGCITGCTGLLRWCPACAIGGRDLSEKP
jgi:hypothetical protein